jgi:2-methylcitrate dehydratase PrpD
MNHDVAVRALMQRVEIEHDPVQEAPKGSPRTESARVIVSLSSGEIHEAYVPFVRGFPSHPMSTADVEAKALELMTPRLGAERARRVVDQVADIEAMTNSGDLTALIAI